MGKEKGADPLQAWRRKEKEKASKAKKKARDEKLSEIPAHRRDPAPLVSEIYRLSVLEYEGRLNSDMKQHRKRLMDQYQSIKKARTTAGIETIELVQFDPEAHEDSKLKQLQAKRRKLELDQSGIPSRSNSNVTVPQQLPAKAIVNNRNLDERGLPRLPESPCPADEELLALGLPAYSPFPFEADEEDKVAVEDEEGEDVELENFNDLEAQLEAEYELFKDSIEQE